MAEVSLSRALGPAGEEFARAKVNLHLHVVGRRADGYHLLDSLVVFPALGDRLRLADAAAPLALEVTGPFAAVLAAPPGSGGGDNLVLRAARALAEVAGVPARGQLVLEKALPVASGIGGGSADAAAALRLLARAWGVSLPADALAALALRLGADVPVCLASRAVRMGGVGEVLSPAPTLPDCGIVLVNPGVAVATPAVFRARSGGFSAPAELPAVWPDAAAMAVGLAGLANDLEAPAVELAPVIGEVLAALRGRPGCLLARMSGSGATCFGLFASGPEARTAAAALRAAQPMWWAQGSVLE